MSITLDTYCDEWRRICEARWYLRDCKDRRGYYDGVVKVRGYEAGQQMLRDAQLVAPHNRHFTKKLAAQLIEQMRQERMAA